MIETNEHESEKSLDHAWDWFSLHAGQRMQSFNFFLVATGFLVAAYASVLKDHRDAGLGIGVFGAWISFWFRHLEYRTRQLVHAGEAALRPLQQVLSERASLPELRILDAVDKPAAGCHPYSKVFRSIQSGILVGFIVAAIYA